MGKDVDVSYNLELARDLQGFDRHFGSWNHNIYLGCWRGLVFHQLSQSIQVLAVAPAIEKLDAGPELHDCFLWPVAKSRFVAEAQGVIPEHRFDTFHQLDSYRSIVRLASGGVDRQSAHALSLLSKSGNDHHTVPGLMLLRQLTKVDFTSLSG
jgi:hypothetical protein